MVLAVVVAVAMAAVERAGVRSPSIASRGESNSSDPSSGKRVVWKEKPGDCTGTGSPSCGAGLRCALLGPAIGDVALVPRDVRGDDRRLREVGECCGCWPSCNSSCLMFCLWRPTNSNIWASAAVSGPCRIVSSTATAL
jgi:hypothetical protein